MDIKIFDHPAWEPLKFFGLTSDFFKIDYQAVISTWLVLILLLIFGLLTQLFYKKSNNIFKFSLTKYVLLFENMVTQALGKYYFNHTVFIAYLFTFLLLCNCLSLLPIAEEPTTNLNTTLALGVIAFLYIQWMTIKKHGLVTYLKNYLEPFIFFFPLNIIGSLATIISLSFRLFGNILGGSVIAGLWQFFVGGSLITELVGIFTGINFLITAYFGIFDGILQAFVFSMLSLTYLSMEIQEDNT